MSPLVDVPLNTAIADLDEGLRSLLRADLRRHGFDGVEVSFDAPSREWSGKLTGPAVNLFLYDIREARDRATSSPETRGGAGETFMVSPPLRLALTYAVTAWTKAVEDEHRLLSQVLAILFSNARLPRDLLDVRASGVRGPARSVGRTPARGQGGFLERGRRPVQGVYRLRRSDRDRIGGQVRARPGGTDSHDPHATVRRPADGDRGDARRRRDRTRRAR